MGQDSELGKGNLACFTEVGDVVLIRWEYFLCV